MSLKDVAAHIHASASTIRRWQQQTPTTPSPTLGQDLVRLALMQLDSSLRANETLTLLLGAILAADLGIAGAVLASLPSAGGKWTDDLTLLPLLLGLARSLWVIGPDVLLASAKSGAAFAGPLEPTGILMARLRHNSLSKAGILLKPVRAVVALLTTAGRQWPLAILLVIGLAAGVSWRLFRSQLSSFLGSLLMGLITIEHVVYGGPLVIALIAALVRWARNPTKRFLWFASGALAFLLNAGVGLVAGSFIPVMLPTVAAWAERLARGAMPLLGRGVVLILIALITAIAWLVLVILLQRQTSPEAKEQAGPEPARSYQDLVVKAQNPHLALLEALEAPHRLNRARQTDRLKLIGRSTRPILYGVAATVTAKVALSLVAT
jgi:hypothetical protein